MPADDPVTQADLEARMNELSAAGGSELDMQGARVLITDPPLRVPAGIWLLHCCFELHLDLPGEGEPWEASYPLDLAAGEAGCTGEVRVDDQGHVYVETYGGGTGNCAVGILKPDGGVLAEVHPLS